MKANELTHVDGQLEMSFPEEMMEVSMDVIKEKPNLLGAIKLCVDLTKYSDAQIADKLGIDTAQWSRIKGGTGHFPPNLLNQLMNVCRNEVPLHWLAYSRGYELKPLLTKLERDLLTEQEKSLELEKENELLRKLVTGKT